MTSVPGTAMLPAALPDLDSLFRSSNFDTTTTLNGGINATDLTIVLTDASKYGNSGALKIDSEIIYWNAKSGNTLTVPGVGQRGAEGTTAANHSNGASVRLMETARSHAVQNDEIIALATKLGVGSSVPAANSLLYSDAGGNSLWSTGPMVDRLSVKPTTPVYDLASGVLSAGIHMPRAADTSVATGKVHSSVRISKDDGGYNTFTLSGTAIAEGLGIYMESDSDSGANSALYGPITAVSNKGPGAVKGTYARAITQSGCTGVVIAGVFATEARAGATCWILQLAGTDNLDNVAFIHADDGVSANLNDGIVYATSIRVQAGGAFLKAFQTTGYTGDFLAYSDQSSNPLFTVDHMGIPRVQGANPSIQLGSDLNGWYTQRLDSGGEWLLAKQGIGTVIMAEGTTGLIVKAAIANPGSTNLASKAAFSIYPKGNKIVIAYSNSGVMTFVTLPMDGSTTTWTHGTSAP